MRCKDKGKGNFNEKTHKWRLFVRFLILTELYVCDPDRIRTCDPQIRNLLLYPTELRNLLK